MQLGDLSLKGEATPFSPLLCWLQWGARSAGGAATPEQQTRRSRGSWRQLWESAATCWIAGTDSWEKSKHPSYLETLCIGLGLFCSNKTQPIYQEYRGCSPSIAASPRLIVQFQIQSLSVELSLLTPLLLIPNFPWGWHLFLSRGW